MLWAAETGNTDILNELAQQSPSLVNCKDDDGYTPLHRAAYSKQLNAVKVNGFVFKYLDHFADIKNFDLVIELKHAYFVR